MCTNCPPKPRIIRLIDLFTEDQIKLAMELVRQHTSPANEICKQITEPNLATINKKSKQENDPKYLAYLLEHVVNQGAYLQRFN